MKLWSNPGAPSIASTRRFRAAGLTSTLRWLFSTIDLARVGTISAV